MYDANNLYFSVYAYDSQPELIVVRSRARDGQILTGDNIQIALDPGLTRRNSYVFMMGPSGGRWDGLRLNNNEELPQWDTLWEGARHARARRLGGRDRDSRSAISPMSRGRPTGVSTSRVTSGASRDRALVVHQSRTRTHGHLGSGNAHRHHRASRQGLGLDIQPYVALRAKHDWSKPDDGAGHQRDGGRQHFLQGHVRR